MTTGRTAILLMVVCGVVWHAVSGLLIAEPEDAATLVGRLPAGSPVRTEAVINLEQSIVALGEQALPALEQELHLGIPFKELNQLQKAKASRRSEVAYVLSLIPGDKSTDLLVKSLSDPPDCYGMAVGTLIALSKRKLSNEQVVAMLGNHEPQIALAGIERAVGMMSAPEVRTAVEKLFDKDAAISQFHNEYGASTANPDVLWEVRLATGKALNQDMRPEMRAKAQEILAMLKQEALHPTEPNSPVFISNGSRAEIVICSGMSKLSTLGLPVKDLVEEEAKNAEGDHAKVLAMTLARLGDRTQTAKVADYLTTADSPTVRFCAALTLRMLRDPTTMPALRKALLDPYQRQDGSCVRRGDGMIYPIRVVAADALVDLGEDPKVIRQEMQK